MSAPPPDPAVADAARELLDFIEVASGYGDAGLMGGWVVDQHDPVTGERTLWGPFDEPQSASSWFAAHRAEIIAGDPDSPALTADIRPMLRADGRTRGQAG